ncbi:hypothetical protein KEM60_03066 [Austwickia sp. TVS 96-490-7B]|uniref:AAA family ATPase n=1 Tax=Austwickia sp. TVS 96-490-7B TaxID=2830843 RepID=UPI001C594F32|nr:ATP-binding protein [Austwickia sp. TVS 96-490-7B]MBW3086837.1 hypothetical protein [Austwickia sp. TVS 96-490-7B]
MLIRFEVENFRSIREPVELSMVAVDDRGTVREKPTMGVSLLPVAAIYGPNASGKSNMLRALQWLCHAVHNSLRAWEDDIPVEPFAFGAIAGSDSSFALEMEIDGVRFEYLLDVGRQKVTYEALYHYPTGRRRKIFERDGHELSLQRGLGELSGTRAMLTERSLALSIMRRFNEPLTGTFAAAVINMVTLGRPLRASRMRDIIPWTTMRLFEAGVYDDQPHLDPEYEQQSIAQMRRDRAISLLRLADLGIADVEIETEQSPQDDLASTRTPWLRKSVYLLHEADGQMMPLDFMEESAGTQTWFQLIGPVLRALDTGSVVLIDELDASLHPILTAKVVELFQGQGSNPHGAQLIFTTHDTNLLNDLKRDEVWLAQKDASGATKFGPLSDFAGGLVRQSRNLENSYLSGRFGGLPDVSRPEVLRALGIL